MPRFNMKDEIVLYRPDELAEHIEVRMGEETVWLSQDQMVRLFERDQSVISRHIRTVFNEEELDEKSNMQKMHIAYCNQQGIIVSSKRRKQNG